MKNFHYSRRAAFVLTAFFCLLLTEFSDVRAQGYQLSQTLQSNQTLANYKVSADGKYAVYQIDTFNEDFSQSSQLFSVDTATRSRKTLTPVIGGDGKYLNTYQITPNSQTVIYGASLEADAFFRSELYSIPIAATNQNQRKNIGNVPANSTADIFDFYISPNSQHVVYERFDENAAGENFRILFRVAPNGGAITQLTPSVADGEAENVIFAPDSSRIVYEFDSPATDGDTVYQSVALNGTGRKTLTDEVSGGGDARITSDSQRYVFTADFTPEDDDVDETSLYSVTLSGSEPRKQLSKTGENVYNFNFANGYPVVVYAFKPQADPGFSPTSFGFVAADKSYESVAFNTGRNLDTFNFAVSPNNASVIYLGDGGGATQLYSLTYQNNAGVERQLSNAPANTGLFTGVSDFKIAPNSSRVVFRATQGNAFAPDLYSAPISNNPVAVKLNNLAGEAGGDADFYGVGSYFITPNSGRVIFGYPPTDGTCCGNNFYTNAIAGGTPTGPFATYANDDSFSGAPVLTADARRLIYTKTVYDENFNAVTSLFAANVP